MINLLPPDQKVIAKKEYTLRLVLMYLLLTSIIVFVGLVLLSPSYFLVDAKESLVESELANLQTSSENIKREEVKNTIKETKEILSALTADSKNIELFSLIDTISKYTENQVNINNISYTRGSDKASTTLMLGGTANTRDSLIKFTKGLEADELFDEVVLPVSSLSKEKNIDFSIQIKGDF